MRGDERAWENHQTLALQSEEQNTQAGVNQTYKIHKNYKRYKSKILNMTV